jgi:predicted small integral membrane protein
MKIPIGVQPEKESIPADEGAAVEQPQQKSSFFSSLSARLFFLLLLIGDVLCLCYALALLCFSLIGSLITLSRLALFSELRANAILTIKRALVCGLSLFVALFSPAFGIMIACTYFLMYDARGIEEVVPSSLQTQFKEFLHR